MPLPFDARMGRVYFAVQAVAGALWWVGVFTNDPIRRLTLGGLDPVLLALLDVPLFVIASALAAAGLRWAVWVVVPWTALMAAGMVVYATVTTTAGWGALLMIAATAGGIGAAILVRIGRLPSEWLLIGPFAFRLATRARPRTHLVRTIVQVCVFWGLFLAVIPVVIVFFERRWAVGVAMPAIVPVAGACVLIAASALGMWSAWSMSTRGDGTPLPSAMPNRLVIVGPYRFVRNPMALAGIAQGVGVGMVAGSWLVVVYALCGSLVWNALIRPLEEADLEQRFGTEFLTYRDRVRCWVPARPVARTAAMRR